MSLTRSRSRSLMPVVFGVIGGALLAIVIAATTRRIDSLDAALLAAAVIGGTAGLFAVLSSYRPAQLAAPARLTTVHVEAPSQIPPHRIHALVEEALRAIDGVDAEASASCRTMRLSASTVEYEIDFTVIDPADDAIVKSNVVTRLWYAMNRHAAIAGRVPTPEEASYVAMTTLESTPLFDLLPADIQREMALRAELELWAAGERVVKQGESADSCFIVRSGRLGVHVSEGDSETRFATLATGDLFGEMSLLTGQARWASVRAEEDSEVLRIRADAMKVALTRSPDLVARIAETVAMRREELMEARALLNRPDAQGVTGGGKLPDAIRKYMEIPDETAIT